jgi:RNA polymerase sigma-70 factor (ECF subfamily)
VATRITDLRVDGDYASLDDRLLVLDFQAGQPEAFVEIHRRYGPLARHVCRRFLPNHQDADDAFQETMIRVFQGLHRFNGQYALQPWVARIATNVSLDQIRTRTRRPQLEDGTIEDHERRDPADGPEEMFDRLVERDLVLSVLSGLPESHRTALVLRELEGRSHREIAQALEITPSQAKALIHRAKGSFRRSWLLAITEKGGLAGIAVVPLLWLARAADGARRLLDRVGGHATQVAQAATPEIVTSAASSPAVVTTASTISERVVAAGMTLLLAGGVTVGAATIVKHRERDADRAAAPPPAAVASPSPELPVIPVPAIEREPRPEPTKDATEEAEPDPSPTDPVVVPPVEDPSSSPTTDPTGSPSPDPTSPSPGPPVIPPAPAWTFDLGATTQSVEACDCPATTLSSSQIRPADDGGFAFSTIIAGGALDGDGDPTWPFYLVQEGSIGPDGGSVEYRLNLTSAAGDFLYHGAAALAETTVADDGSTLYRFEGTFDLLNPTTPYAGLPWRGSVSITLGVWADGTVYTGSFALTDLSS